VDKKEKKGKKRKKEREGNLNNAKLANSARFFPQLPIEELVAALRRSTTLGAR